MKIRRNKKQIGLLAQHLKCFSSLKFIIIVIIFAGLSAGAGAFKAVYGKNTAIFDKQFVPISESGEAFSAPVFSSLNLSYDIGVYVYSKKKYVCRDYRNNIKSDYFSMRCKDAKGIWRGHLVKKIDVAGYNKLRVKASLGVNDYTDYFAECGHKGVNRDDFISLAAVTFDPEETFRWDCNHAVAEEKWSMCQVLKTDPGVAAYCGVSMCSKGRSCDFEIDVSKNSAIYLLFSVNDAWLADIEGSLSNAEYALIK